MVGLMTGCSKACSADVIGGAGASSAWPSGCCCWFPSFPGAFGVGARSPSLPSSVRDVVLPGRNCRSWWSLTLPSCCGVVADVAEAVAAEEAHIDGWLEC